MISLRQDYTIRFLTNNSLNENEIIEWANGINETTVSDNTNENYELANVEIILDETHVENSKSMNDIINSFNMIIEWVSCKHFSIKLN